MEATDPWDVALMVSRGTSSATFLYSAAQAAAEAWENDAVETVILALYDHDAAGKRCARTVERGFAEYAPDVPVRFQLLALNEGQVEAWGLPTRPAKKTDPEAAKFAGPAVELDAIPPDRLIQLTQDAIVARIDAEAWQKELAYESSERDLLERIVGGAT